MELTGFLFFLGLVFEVRMQVLIWKDLAGVWSWSRAQWWKIFGSKQLRQIFCSNFGWKKLRRNKLQLFFW